MQVVFDKLPKDSLIRRKLKFDNQKLEGEFQQNYTTYDRKILSEFQRPIKVNGAIIENHVLSFETETETDFNQIRIVLHFKNPVGSGIHQKIFGLLLNKIKSM